MREKMNILYPGNLTCCGTHAVYSAFFQKWDYQDIMRFEAVTTVPFGIVHNPQNLFRLFTCYCDPDRGIEYAFEILGLAYRLRYFESACQEREALEILEEWLEEGSVVLGPLNMEDLNYISHSNLLQAMDHYIVVCKVERGKYEVCDSEGMCLTGIDKEALVRAWAADKIPEGRGRYIMRQVLSDTLPVFGKEVYRRAGSRIADNLSECESKDNCGSNGLYRLAESSEYILSDANLKRRMCFDIPVRIQRCETARCYLGYLCSEFSGYPIKSECVKAAGLLWEQIRGYNSILWGIRKRNGSSFEIFQNIARLEHELAGIFKNIWEEM